MARASRTAKQKDQRKLARAQAILDRAESLEIEERLRHRDMAETGSHMRELADLDETALEIEEYGRPLNDAEREVANRVKKRAMNLFMDDIKQPPRESSTRACSRRAAHTAGFVMMSLS